MKIPYRSHLTPRKQDYARASFLSQRPTLLSLTQSATASFSLGTKLFLPSSSNLVYERSLQPNLCRRLYSYKYYFALPVAKVSHS